MSTSARKCQQCGAPIESSASHCKFCGAEVVAAPPQTPQYTPSQAPQYAPPQTPPANTGTYNTSGKNRTTAGILAILVGGLGIHKFYLGKIGMGILYLLFCWTYIPSIVGVIEGIMYLTKSDEEFYQKYVKK